MRSFRRITEPTVEPLTLEQAKAHLRLRTDDQDARVLDAIKASRDAIEEITGRALLTQEWALRLDAVDVRRDGAIELVRPPVQAVLAVMLSAPGAAPVAIAGADYVLDDDAEPGRLVWGDGKYATALGAFAARPAALRITTRNGYGDAAAAVPPGLVQACYQLMATFFLHREDGIVLPVSQALEAAPAPVRELLESYRVGGLA